ncbi:solute carrier family 2, facilitated glucose transporter member 5-like [Podarcis lilfordi]|uniref:Solute carrier family 2, facilitated glucose transporter member 5 n=1 Tax=Podarcis lilfordi TaxID=74358 RepID=A0AA35PB98_9SAUR|nr:solute carrier family 2, facilitated glucose transporter member 5-like [Podarcis lilfordi]
MKKTQVASKAPTTPKASAAPAAPAAPGSPRKPSAPSKPSKPSAPNEPSEPSEPSELSTPIAPIAATSHEDVPMRLIWISMAACLITVQYGYNMWLLYTPFVLLHDLFNITTYEEMEDPGSQMYIVAITLALFPLGAIFGSIPVGYLANRFGRKGAVKITTFLSLIPPVLLAVGNKVNVYEFTIAVRFYTGICTGLISVVVPLYLGEIAPGSVRGAIIMMSQLFYSLGLFIGQLIVAKDNFKMRGGYVIVMGISGVMPIFQIILLPFFPESPRYLLIQRKNAESAREVLKVLRGKDDVENEIDELRQEDLFEKAEKNMTAAKLLSSPNLRTQVITIVVLTGGAQLDGIGAVHYYVDIICMAAGADEKMLQWLRMVTIIIGLISLMIAMYLADSKGHRYLLLTGFLMCSIVCVLLTMALEMQVTIDEMAYVNILLVQVFVIAHSVGPGPLPNVIVVALFLQSSRASAFVIAGFVQWFTHFLMMMVFLQIVTKIGTYSFLMFLPFCGGLFIYIFKNFPETKNRTFVDIRRIVAVQKLRKTKLKKPTEK